MASVGLKSCFVCIFKVHSNFVIATSQIQVRKECCPMQFIIEFIYHGIGNLSLTVMAFKVQ